MKRAIVAFSFGLRKGGPCDSNIALARAIGKFPKGIMVVAQREIAALLKSKPALVIRKHRIQGKYLDSDEVAAQAADFLRKKKISEAIVVAHPFLHIIKCKQLMQKGGFAVTVPDIGKIPFDKESEQWWSRSAFNFLVYAVLQKLTGRRGH